MSKKIALTIAEPCHENWDGMTSVEKGKFCGSCQKKVIDFSTMGDRQIAEFFKKPSTGSVCGRFMTDQLNREIEIPKKRIPWVKYFFNILLPAIFISKASAQNNEMGKISAVNMDTIRVPMTNEFRTLGMVINNRIDPFMGDTTSVDSLVLKSEGIKGIIKNETGETIPFASIQVGNSGNYYVTDENGEFKINATLLGQSKSLLVSSVGYKSKEIMIENSSTILQVELSTLELGEVTVSSSTMVKGKVSMIMGAVAIGVPVCTNEVTDEIVSRDIEVPQSQNKLFVYPNPLLSGGNITLGIAMLEEGYYAFNLINMSGQQTQQREIWIDGAAKVLNLELPKVAAGSYFIVLINKKTGKKISEKIIIQ